MQLELLRLLKRGNQTNDTDMVIAAEMADVDSEYEALCLDAELAAV